jgi:myo-inositol 2-dehydrogenase/D-chiro-inositol 1-dehydrogenase
MAAEPVRVCIVGLGWTGMNHARGYATHPDLATITAVVVRSPEGRARARELGVTRIYDDWRVALADADLDAMDFCTPTFLHAEQSVAALDAGKHVMCETPACQTLDECRAIRWSIVEHPHHIAVTGHIARHWPTFAEAKRRVTAGDIGTVFHVSAAYAHKADPNEYASSLTWSRNLAQRARLGVGHHGLDLMRYFAGDVFEVGGDQTPLAGAAVLRFTNGALGHVFASGAVVRPYILQVEIHGSEGSIVTYWEEQELRGVLHRSSAWQPERLTPTPLHGRGSPEWGYEMANFARSIRGLESPVCPMLDGVAMVETGIAIQHAIDIGTRVRVIS